MKSFVYTECVPAFQGCKSMFFFSAVSFLQESPRRAKLQERFGRGALSDPMMEDYKTPALTTEPPLFKSAYLENSWRRLSFISWICSNSYLWMCIYLYFSVNSRKNCKFFYVLCIFLCFLFKNSRLCSGQLPSFLPLSSSNKQKHLFSCIHHVHVNPCLA